MMALSLSFHLSLDIQQTFSLSPFFFLPSSFQLCAAAAPTSQEGGGVKQPARARDPLLSLHLPQDYRRRKRDFVGFPPPSVRQDGEGETGEFESPTFKKIFIPSPPSPLQQERREKGISKVRRKPKEERK